MIIKNSDLDLTLKVIAEYKVPEGLAHELLFQINDRVEKGYNCKRTVEEVHKVLKGTDISKTCIQLVFTAYTKDATKTLKERKEALIHDHLLKYDKLIESQLRDPKVKDPRFFHKAKLDKLLGCLDTMRQKETLLGLHRKNVRIILNNKIKQQRLQKENSISQIDMTQLTIQEKIELNALLEKAKGYSIITDTTMYKDQNTVVDIEHEEVKQEIISPMINIAKVNGQPEELVNKPKTQIHDIKKSLKEKFNQLAKEKFSKIGVQNI